ncbi:MAG: YdeI/OmpD-associated family protein [Gemmatimonadota bacterium]
MPKEQSTAKYFASADAWREWLAAHHQTESELLVGFHKAATGKPRMTWAESVDEALCHGWIDGVRRRVDEERYTIRFTPRKATSIWSAVNIRRVAELETEGRMQAAGHSAFAKRRENRSRTYAYEQRPESLDEPYAATFRKRAKAWAFFEAQPPSYRQTAIWWVISAKQEATRQKRLAQLIDDSSNSRRLARLTRTPTPR